MTIQNYGICYFSSFIEKATPALLPLVSKISNINEFIKLLLFDHIINNVDRHEGNILFSLGKPIRLFAIDHSNIFGENRGWSAQKLQAKMHQKDYLDILLKTSENENTYQYFWAHAKCKIKDFTRESELITSKLTPQVIHNIVHNVPIEWKSFVSQEDFIALEQYLNYRILHINDICDAIMKERRIVE